MNKTVLLDPADTVMLLLDHQNGLFQTVKDVPLAELRTNTVVLAKVARLANIPLIITASVPDGPNGPLMHELQEVAPDATYVPRKGEISAWDNEDFVRTVKNTGRKTLILAGVWTSVCVAFPALQAKAEGYNVYFVTDASGDPSPMASQTTVARMVQAGIIPMSTCAVFCTSTMKSSSAFRSSRVVISARLMFASALVMADETLASMPGLSSVTAEILTEAVAA